MTGVLGPKAAAVAVAVVAGTEVADVTGWPQSGQTTAVSFLFPPITLSLPFSNEKQS